MVARGRSQETVIYFLAGPPELTRSPEFVSLNERHRALLRATAAGDWPAAEQALIEARLLAGRRPSASIYTLPSA